MSTNTNINTLWGSAKRGIEVFGRPTPPEATALAERAVAKMVNCIPREGCSFETRRTLLRRAQAIVIEAFHGLDCYDLSEVRAEIYRLIAYRARQSTHWARAKRSLDAAVSGPYAYAEEKPHRWKGERYIFRPSGPWPCRSEVLWLPPEI